MAAPTSFQQLVDDTYLGDLERQRRLLELVGEGTPYDGRYDIDLQAGTLRFTGAQVLEVRAHLLGSAAPGPGTWLWGWRNVNGYPAAVVEVAEGMRVLGERWGIPELASAEVPLWDAPRAVAARMGAVVGMFAGGLPTYTVEVGGGTVAALLLEHEMLVLPTATAQSALFTLTAGLAHAPEVVVDWWRAVDAYGYRRGLRIDPQPDGTVRLVGPDGYAEVAFDDHGRIASLTGRIDGAP